MDKKSLYLFSVFFFLLLFFVFLPKKIYAQYLVNMDCDNGFSQLFDGIVYKNETVVTSIGQNVIVHVVKVDLNANLDFLVTPRDDMGTTTSTFMTTHNAVIAVNGDYHYTSPWDPFGLAVSETDIYSAASAEPSMFISEQNEITFFSRRGNSLWDAISGAHSLLRRGNLAPSIEFCSEPVHCTHRHPRTAIGIRGDELTLMVVEGRLAGLDQGVTLRELADLLLQCRVRNAINFDGGGSSTLASTSEPDLLLNRPSGGRERAVANHFGICLGACSTQTATPPPVPRPVNVSGEARPRYQHSSGELYPFPCNRIAPEQAYSNDNEFHSLRPYQASPCNPNAEDLALFCGNNITLESTVDATKTISGNYPPFSQTYSPNPATPTGLDCAPNCSNIDPYCTEFERCAGCCGACHPTNDGEREICYLTASGTRSVAVDVSGAEFPIMGYTEPSLGNEDNPNPKVVNSINDDLNNEDLTDSQKVNEYVSWYLNGVNNRAEYPPLEYESRRVLTNPNTWFLSPRLTEESTRKLIDFSGPVKKLLPLYVQNKERETESIQAYTSRRSNSRIRHDQIAGCLYGINIHIPLIDNDYFIGGITAPCYEGGFLNGVLDLLGIHSINPRVRLSQWYQNDEIPPLEEDYQNLSYDTFLLDYREWRGQYCLDVDVPLPVIGARTMFYCFDSPTSPNVWSNLYPNIPFSSTEDRLGEVAIRNAIVQPPISPDFTITYSAVTNVENADLFVPHMEEAVDLADSLQKTYSPLGVDLETMTGSTYVPSSPYCDIRTVRSNPGDDLFAGELSADLEYAAEFRCEFMLPGEGRLCEAQGGTCTSVRSDYNCPSDYGSYDCQYESPYDLDPAPGGNCIVDPGSCSPAVSNDGGFGCDSLGGYKCVIDSWTHCDQYPSDTQLCSDGYICVEDSCTRPTDSAPDYTDTCSQEISVTIALETRTPLADKVWARLVAGTMGVFRRMFPKVDEGGAVEVIWDIPAATGAQFTSLSGSTVYAGDPRNRTPGDSASLYFPHIGGVKEYFLTGIQTLLRPRGYGNQIVSEIYDSGEVTSSTGTCPLGSGYCDVSYLANTFGSEASEASQICQWESGSYPLVLNDDCLTGGTYDYSVGLFQINLVPIPYYDSSGNLIELRDSTRCPGAFSTDITQVQPPRCVVINQATLDNCVAEYSDPDYNIYRAYQIGHCTESGGVTTCNWSPWSAAAVCNIQ